MRVPEIGADGILSSSAAERDQDKVALGWARRFLMPGSRKDKYSR